MVQTQSMQWRILLNAQRLGQLDASLTQDSIAIGGHKLSNSHEQGRTPFHKDYDRIVFSSAFRRLAHKTQVHSLSHNDHVHNRLTHSLEVSSVGRSLGIRVSEYLCQQKDWPTHISPYDVGAIVQSACLAHDIGNPPFGHFGENAIRAWFEQYAHQGYLQSLTAEQLLDFTHFEGNAQGLRTLTQLEYHRFEGGMRLTYATLGSFLKYPWLASANSNKMKYGVLQAEENIVAHVAKQLGLIQVDEGRWCRHPLVYLVEAADDICYAIIDLEDGVELGILDEQEVVDLLACVAGEPDVLEQSYSVDGYYSTRRLALMRGKVMDYLVNACTSAFIENQALIMQGKLQYDLITYTDQATQQVIKQAKNLARHKLFANQQRYLTELGAQSVLHTVLSTFVPIVMASTQVPSDTTDKYSQTSYKYLSLLGIHKPDLGTNPYKALCQLMDFVSGMTDKFAIKLARQLNGELE